LKVFKKIFEDFWFSFKEQTKKNFLDFFETIFFHNIFF
jgi:hypothetical protein